MPSDPILTEYFKSLAATAARGDAREESFYSALEGMLEQVASSTGRERIQVTTLPKKTEAGNPDFRVWDGHAHIVGYVEAKRPGEENLDAIEDSEQLQRYLSTFPNLILTNFCEFRLYRNGEPVNRVLAARPMFLHKLGTVPPVEKGAELRDLLEQFFSFSLPKSFTAESLAVELAKRTRFLRDVVAAELKEEQEKGEGTLLGFYEAFQTYLIARLSLEDFADLYAQTITYGLFAARTRAEEKFSRRTAFENIPRTIGILRDVFRFISLEELSSQLAWIVDDIAEVLAVADAGEILDRFYHQGKGSDPIVHFYETFLAAYDPAERERRGVYYTPEPVVSYIVRSLHKLLKSEFGRKDGLASEGVTLLDPAAGTMTFVARAAEEAVHEFEEKYGTGGREEFIRDHVLKNFYAFELMMAPYAVGHLKMSFYLEELGHKLSPDERFKLYLTNALEMEELEQTNLPGMRSLAHESHLAGTVKKQTPILVILGNPPYSGISSNKGTWITEKIETYKYVDGEHFGERKHWLQDDYVKFIRFAQWKIDQAGKGVIGFITNHGYLDNPTFRGMRQSLMRSFDEIRVLDLHGNSLKKEVAPEGKVDTNVFDIRQGVAVTFFIKRGSNPIMDAGAQVHHAELWGTRTEKYNWLHAHDYTNTEWVQLGPNPPLYLFSPRQEIGLAQYKAFPDLTEIFPISVAGIITARDRFVIGFTQAELQRRLDQFRNLSFPDELIRESYDLKNTRGWKLAEARKDVAADEAWKTHTRPVLYRPFDVRAIYFTDTMVDWPRPEVMRHMMHENLALIAPRQHKGDFGAFVSTVIGTHKTVAVYDINYYYPLYLYPDTTRQDLFSHTEEAKERKPNLNPKLLGVLADAYGQEPAPKEVFFYTYSVLYATSYRERYFDFLKTDFPRIPFTADRELFRRLAALGKRLSELHLLRSPELDPPAARFYGEGDSTVAKNRAKGFRYEPEQQRVYINATQYFEPVPPELWEYAIGGYQVPEKWLKDRRERKLSVEEIRTYCRIITALQKTVEIQEEIDALYSGVEEGIVEISL